MHKTHAFFIVVAFAVAANHLVLSTSTVDEKSKVVDRDEERGEEAVKLFGQTIAKKITLLGKKIVVPEDVKPTGQILSESEQDAFPQMVYAEGNPRQKYVKLFGVTIPAPEQVPEAVAQRTSQGNIGNNLADNIEKTTGHPTNVLLETQPRPSSSAQGKLPSTMTEVEPLDPTAAEELSPNLRGVKRKDSSHDKAQSPQSKNARREEQLGQANALDYMRPLSYLKELWGIDPTQLKQRKKEFDRYKLPFGNHRTETMALGSLFFERRLPERTKKSGDYLVDIEIQQQTWIIQALGLDFVKVRNRMLSLYDNGLLRPRLPVIFDMAIGMEFYILHPPV